MCGFVGYIPGNGKLDNEETLSNMLKTIVHRGPDDQEIYVDRKIKLGFSRLSILDLSSAANQPLMAEDVVLVFNGEVYNFRELRKELIEEGYEFFTSSDSEVLLKGYLHFGEAIVKKLRGMFAFCIWDQRNNKVMLARDPFGIKPLYYSRLKDGTTIFGSEIKAFFEHPGFEKKLNKRALRPYLTFQYSVLDETFFEGVHRVQPGTYMVGTGDGDWQTTNYFDKRFKTKQKSMEDYVKDIKEAVADSVEAHKVSDVKVGSFLSGGIDSSYITSLLKPQKAFTVGFKDYEDMFDETKFAIELAELIEVDIEARYVSDEESFEVFPEIQWHMDEPHSDPSIIPLYFLNELASKDVTVILSGEGADELFGGYEWYQKSEKMDTFHKLPQPVKNILHQIAKRVPEKNPVARFVRKAMKPIEERFIGHALVWDEKDAISVLKEPYRVGPSVQDVVNPYYNQMNYSNETDKMQHLDFDLWLPRSILLKADKMSMAHSIELRVPFLDQKVFEASRQLPEDKRVGYGKTKVALREAALDHLPDEWAKRKKLGFPVPIRHWLKKERFYKKVKETFLQDYVNEFFDQKQLLGYLDAHYHGEGNYARYIWTVYSFCVWYEVVFPEKV